VDFTRCNLTGLRLKDVRLVECDFANSEAIGIKGDYPLDTEIISRYSGRVKRKP
jgi:hypothetical protein